MSILYNAHIILDHNKLVGFISLLTKVQSVFIEQAIDTILIMKKSAYLNPNVDLSIDSGNGG